MDTLLDIIDIEDNDDGGDDHDIGFREFARVMGAADVFKMRALAPRPDSKKAVANENLRMEALGHLRLGVTQEEMRKAQTTIKEKISAKHGKHAFTNAFKWMDKDRTGSITREEFKQALYELNLGMAIRDDIINNLCDFIDVRTQATTKHAPSVQCPAPDCPRLRPRTRRATRAACRVYAHMEAACGRGDCCRANGHTCAHRQLLWGLAC